MIRHEGRRGIAAKAVPATAHLATKEAIPAALLLEESRRINESKFHGQGLRMIEISRMMPAVVSRMPSLVPAVDALSTSRTAAATPRFGMGMFAVGLVGAHREVRKRPPAALRLQQGYSYRTDRHSRQPFRRRHLQPRG
jgi:hypothetical protein